MGKTITQNNPDANHGAGMFTSIFGSKYVGFYIPAPLDHGASEYSTIPPIITIFIGEISTVPSHGWFMTLF